MMTTKVFNLWMTRFVRTDPPYANPSWKIEARNGGGVPTQTLLLLTENEMLIWEPSGEVRTLRCRVIEQQAEERKAS